MCQLGCDLSELFFFYHRTIYIQGMAFGETCIPSLGFLDDCFNFVMSTYIRAFENKRNLKAVTKFTYMYIQLFASKVITIYIESLLLLGTNPDMIWYKTQKSPSSLYS